MSSGAQSVPSRKGHATSITLGSAGGAERSDWRSVTSDVHSAQHCAAETLGLRPTTPLPSRSVFGYVAPHEEGGTGGAGGIGGLKAGNGHGRGERGKGGREKERKNGMWTTAHRRNEVSILYVNRSSSCGAEKNTRVAHGWPRVGVVVACEPLRSTGQTRPRPSVRRRGRLGVEDVRI